MEYGVCGADRSHYLSSFQLSRLIEGQLSSEDVEELARAEELTMRFLEGDIGVDGDGDVLEWVRELVS